MLAFALSTRVDGQFNAKTQRRKEKKNKISLRLCPLALNYPPTHVGSDANVHGVISNRGCFMVKDLFGNLLSDIGTALNIRDLHPDQANSCLIKMPSGVKIQLEIDKRGENLLMGCELGVLMAGKYRENIFQEALKANGNPPPHNGIFAFSKKSDKLVLYEKIPLKHFSVDKVIGLLTPFSEKAKAWIDALARGDMPPPSSFSTTSSGMFGLR